MDQSRPQGQRPRPNGPNASAGRTSSLVTARQSAGGPPEEDACTHQAPQESRSGCPLESSPPWPATDGSEAARGAR